MVVSRSRQHHKERRKNSMGEIRTRRKEDPSPPGDSILPLNDEGFSEWSKRVDHMFKDWMAREVKKDESQ